MRASRLHRVRTMGRDEIAFRARVAVRTRIERLSVAARRPRWNRGDLSRVLAAHVLEAPLATAIEQGDWTAAQGSLERVLRGRPSRFVIDPATAGGLRAEILRRWPTAADDARLRADRIAMGDYDLLGYRGLAFAGHDGAMDWHLDPVTRRRAPNAFWADVAFLDPAIGDHKVIWEINRHQHWMALGRALWLTDDRRFRKEIVAQLESWLAANPPLTGINWASMLELGFRSLSWLWAMHMLLREPGEGESGEGAWAVDMLVAIHHQMEHIGHNLSCYFSPNTHLLGEALALYVVGQSLPELARSPRWMDIGRRILLEQVHRQIEPDGGHAERSLHYHRYAHDFYLLALLTAERCGDDEAAAAFREASGRMAAFLRELADDTGRVPLIGDDDGGMLCPLTGRDSADVRDSLSLSATVLGRPELAPWGLCEEAIWLAWSGYRDRVVGDVVSPPGEQGDAKLTVFPATGYVAVRDGQGGHLVCDAGPHGYLNCGHAHADALAVTLAVAGRPLLVDPGTGSYTVDARVRDRLRRTANHNTLTVDDRSSSTPAGPFHWRTRVDARLDTAVGNARFGWVEASHDGYPRLRHRRNIALVDGGWLFVDELLGDGAVDAQVHWHFDALWSVARASNGALAARHRDGPRAWLVHDASALSLAFGDDESGLGWCSPRYGVVVPIWSARLSRTGAAPLSMVTWIGAAAEGERAPSLERVPVEPSGRSTIAAVRVRRPGATSVTMMRPGGAPARDDRSCDVGDYHTDARLLHYTVQGGRLRSVAIAGASRAIALREGLLSIAADVHIADLHVAVLDGRLDIRASTPPPQLRITGRALDPIGALRLNGRHATIERRDPDGAVVLSGTDWPARAVDAGVDRCVA